MDTVQQCLEDWLASLTTQAQTTVVGNRIAADHMIGLLGRIKLANLKAHDVQGASPASVRRSQPAPAAGRRTLLHPRLRIRGAAVA